MDDLLRINSLLKGYQKGKSFVEKIDLPFSRQPTKPLELQMTMEKPQIEGLQDSNKVGFLTFREIQL